MASDTLPKNYAIIVAGGSGTRMQSAVPKQFLLLCGKPVIMYTIEAFFNSAAKPGIILVLPAEYHAYWQKLCTDHHFTIAHQLVTGGQTRFHSVKNGLDSISNDTDAVIAVHDAVRPLTSRQIINETYKHAALHGNAVTAVKSRDSVRSVKNGISQSLIRDEIYLVQTPQTFQSAQIKKAYLQPFDTKFTDDASVVEETGVAINLIEGNYENIKITFPEDIAIAEMLIKKSVAG
ncbi:2-C-methyl-D-erythritol 4-phosphate cytidylyltransferase [Mucilaginibacter sp.]|uniref:2-C-methyl-D-erythritol 4-phosphate cytidylyltransferase n=1 Tax=Mucilaginibacter sp. TaxID=1882438 RepID=UPI003D100059